MRHSIGIDIGGTNTRIAVVNQAGKIVENRFLHTNDYDYSSHFLADLRKEIGDLITSIEYCQLTGIGIGSPGAQSKTGVIGFTANLNWDEPVNIVEELSTYFSTPVYLTNDANLFAIGEKAYGLAKALDHFLFITLGTGVGGAAYAEGKLIEGQNGASTEFGHIIIHQDGRQCGCGRKGCLEPYTSAIGICLTAKEKIKKHPDSILKSQRVLSSKKIYEAALQGDVAAKETLSDTGKALGIALANLVACFDPQAIFLSGGVMNAGDHLLEPLKATFRQNLLKSYDPNLPILRSSLPENDAAVLGASALTLRDNHTNTITI